MAYQAYTNLPQTEASLKHILNHRDAYLKDRAARQLPSRPFVVGISGCQGSGKTTLCDTLTHVLSNDPYNLNVVSFSLDDFYLTRADQIRLAAAHPTNALLQYRGQPGSHDLALAQTTLNSLVNANAEAQRDKSTAVSVLIPSYDKSLHGGLGDRRERSQWKTTYGPYDIILFEGWSQGFKPLPDTELARVYDEACKAAQGNGLRAPSRLPKHSLADLRQINTNLRGYQDTLYPFFDIFIHLSPANLELVYAWRLEQEHHMKRTRGVDGLSDEAVAAFVDTYMPAYELYLPRLDRVGFYGQGQHGEPLLPFEGPERADGGYSRPDRHLRMVLDQHRRVIQTQHIKETVVTALRKDRSSVTPSSASNFLGQSVKSLRSSRLLLGFAVISLLSAMGYARRQRLWERLFGGK